MLLRYKFSLSKIVQRNVCYRKIDYLYSSYKHLSFGKTLSCTSFFNPTSPLIWFTLLVPNKI